MNYKKSPRNQTVYFENENNWLCFTCFNITPNFDNKCRGCGMWKGAFQSANKSKKKLLQKEWDRLKTFNKEQINGEIFYMDMQMLLCQKYDITITDWLPKWTRRYKTLKKYINMTNFNKGMSTFNKGVQQFSGSIGQVGNELGGGKRNRSSVTRKNKKNIESLWGIKKRKTKLQVKIWNEPRKPRKKKYERKKDKDAENLKKLWGN